MDGLPPYDVIRHSLSIIYILILKSDSVFIMHKELTINPFHSYVNWHPTSHVVVPAPMLRDTCHVAFNLFWYIPFIDIVLKYLYSPTLKVCFSVKSVLFYLRLSCIWKKKCISSQIRWKNSECITCKVGEKVKSGKG